MILQGHETQPTFGLAWSSGGVIQLASGGRDGNILVWNLDGHLNAKEGFKVTSPTDSNNSLTNASNGAATRNTRDNL